MFIISLLYSLSVDTLFGTFVSTALSRITANGMAAWRSGGFPALPFKAALPAAVAPNRSL